MESIKKDLIKIRDWIQKNIFDTKWKLVAIFLPIIVYIAIMSVVSISKYNLFRNGAHCTGIFLQAICKF